EKYPHIDTVLPAMGYGEQQLKDLEETINKADCDAVIIGTPMDLTRIINIEKPTTRVYYDLDEVGTPNLETVLADFTQQFEDRKSTRLNSSHVSISYAVFCVKKKKTETEVE